MMITRKVSGLKKTLLRTQSGMDYLFTTQFLGVIPGVCVWGEWGRVLDFSYLDYENWDAY